MTDIPAFEIHTGLDILGKISVVSDFVNVSNFKKIKFCYYSDIPINLCVVFSYNGVDDGPIYSNDYVARNCWKNFEIDVCMNFVKMIITKMNNKDVNQVLHITSRGYSVRGNKIAAAVSKIEGKEEVVSSNSSTPPKRSFVDKIKGSPSNYTSKSGSVEMPSLCLPNQLFVGGKNKVNVIPPPDKDGQTLMFKDGCIKWV